MKPHTHGRESVGTAVAVQGTNLQRADLKSESIAVVTANVVAAPIDGIYSHRASGSVSVRTSATQQGPTVPTVTR